MTGIISQRTPESEAYIQTTFANFPNSVPYSFPSIIYTVTVPSIPNLTPTVAPTPTTATVGTPQAFTATINNNGTASTGASFNNFFRVATQANGGGTVSTLSVTSRALLTAGASGDVTSSAYTFSSAGTYSVQVCADNDTSMAGTITESNE